MNSFDYPNINISKKSNEENLLATRSWAVNLSDYLNVYIPALEARIEALESKLSESEG